MQWQRNHRGTQVDLVGATSKLRQRETMQQNKLYLVIGALVVVVIGLGIYVLREETKPEGVELRIDDSGISLEQK